MEAMADRECPSPPPHVVSNWAINSYRTFFVGIEISQFFNLPCSITCLNKMKRVTRNPSPTRAMAKSTKVKTKSSKAKNKAIKTKHAAVSSD